MYRWRIDLILKNSGKELTVFYESKTAKNSKIAANEIWDDTCVFSGFMSADDTKNILVRLDEIAVMTISFA